MTNLRPKHPKKRSPLPTKKWKKKSKQLAKSHIKAKENYQVWLPTTPLKVSSQNKPLGATGVQDS